MGFTAAAVFAPNVPDKMDPIRYLTMPPQSRIQEQAQVQAQALAYAKMHGMGPAELERIIFGAEQQKPAMAKTLSLEEIQEYQDAKTCVIPTKITPLPEVPNTTIDYPYLFTNVRIRNPYQFMEISTPPLKHYQRETSRVGTRSAPVLRLNMHEYHCGTQFLENIKGLLAEYGIVKLHLPKPISTRLPFGPDVTGFRTRQQTILRSKADFDLRQIKRGFHRALIRFHSTSDSKKKLQKLPIFEGKPLDFYRLYHIVEHHGGADTVTKRKEWAQVGREMGYSSYAMQTLSSTMRQMHSRVLQPFKEFISENLPSPLEVHCIPRFDVDDEQSSNWCRLPHSIVVDTEAREVSFAEREILDFEDVKNNSPSYTLKLFRQKHYDAESAQLTCDEQERKYMQLPEFFQTEKIYPRAKLHRYPQEASHLCGADNTPDKFWDPWDITALALRENNDFFPYIQQDFVNFLTAELDICGTFATQQMQKTKGGAYEINIVVDGAPRTWYTKSGTWTDQRCSEVVIVDPNAEVSHWSQGYSAMATAPVIMNSNWLENACMSYLEGQNPYVNVQQVVATIAKACSQHKGPLKPLVKSQALSVLKSLKEYELLNIAELGSCETRKVMSDLSLPIRCSRNNQLLYFSWVSVEKTNYSLSEYLKLRQSENVSGAVLMTRYDDAKRYFDQMKNVIESCPETNFRDWLNEVDQEVHRNETIVNEISLRKFIETAPQQYEVQANALNDACVKLKCWVDEGCSLENFQKMVECNDREQKVSAAFQQLSAHRSKGLGLWNEFMQAARKYSADLPSENGHTLQPINPEPMEEVAMKVLEEGGQYLGTEHLETAKRFHGLIAWSREAAKILFKAQTEPRPGLFDPLKHMYETGVTLNIPIQCGPFNLLARILSQAREAEVKIRALWRSGFSGFSAKVIAYKAELFDPFQGLPIMDPNLHAEFWRVFQSLAVINNMKETYYLRRPKRSEISGLMFLQIVSSAVEKLDEWLEEAKQLDWVTIATRLSNMAAMTPPAVEPNVPLISISRIIQVFSQLYQLKVLPDDVESVKITFENTIERLTLLPLPSVRPYGFIP